MQRANRKYVLLAVLAYLVIMVAAYRWSLQQIPTDGPLLTHIEREEVRKMKERQAAEAIAKAQAKPDTAEARMSHAGVAYVAARYDATHVVFVVSSESRFSPIRSSVLAGTPTRLPAPEKTFAPLAGMQELWEPDPNSLRFFPKLFQTTKSGDSWTLSLSSTATIPVLIERPIIAPTGCSLGIGFLAMVPANQQAAFATSPREYFVVRQNPVDSADPPANVHVVELTHWKASPTLAHQIEVLLNERMKQEVAQLDLRITSNVAELQGVGAVGGSRPSLREWLHADKSLTRGEGALEYDLHAYALTPDGIPRLFVRARWRVNASPVFLMTAWFKAPADSDASDELPILLFADSSWSLAMREGTSRANLGDTLAFQTVLNQFDADHDGWGELLVHSQVPDSEQDTEIAPYLYTDQTLVPMKIPFRRDLQPPASCLDP